MSGSAVVGYLLRRRALEDELRLEMEAHRAQMGEPPAFGNTLRLREEARDAWGWRWLDDLVQDTRFAWRTLRHSPAFALTAIVTLALGIGVNIGMFSLINGLLLRPLYPGADDVFGVHSRSTAPSGRNRAFSYPNYRDIREGTTDIFANLAASSTGFVGLDVGDGPRSTYGSAVTANYFQVFAAPPAHGRAFTAEEEQPGAGIRVAIISYSLWEQRGADPDMLGRLVRINGEPFTVVGVARKGFAGTSIPGPGVWLPLGARETFRTEDRAGRPFGARETHELGVVGRLRPGMSVETAAAALATVGRRLEQAFPSVNAGYSLAMAKPSGRLIFLPGGSGGLTGWALLLMLMPLIVLLVACLNLADLLLARGHVRRQELAIRSSLGGGRSRLIRQLLTEGLLLALAGGVVGLWLSTWATDALLASLRPMLPVAVTLPDVSLDWRVLLGTVVFSLVATLVFSAGPALALTGRAAAADLKRHILGRRRTRAGRRPARQCAGHRPDRALAAPAGVRWPVHDECDQGGHGRSRISSRRRIDRGNRSGSGRVRRSARAAGTSRAARSAANGPRRRSGDYRIASAFHVQPGTVAKSRPSAGAGDRCRNRDPWPPSSASSAATTRGSSDFRSFPAVISAMPNCHPAPQSGWQSSTMRSRRSCGRERTHSDG